MRFPIKRVCWFSELILVPILHEKRWRKLSMAQICCGIWDTMVIVGIYFHSSLDSSSIIVEVNWWSFFVCSLLVFIFNSWHEFLLIKLLCIFNSWHEFLLIKLLYIIASKQALRFEVYIGTWVGSFSWDWFIFSRTFCFKVTLGSCLLDSISESIESLKIRMPENHLKSCRDISTESGVH